MCVLILGGAGCLEAPPGAGGGGGRDASGACEEILADTFDGDAVDDLRWGPYTENGGTLDVGGGQLALGAGPGEASSFADVWSSVRRPLAGTVVEAHFWADVTGTADAGVHLANSDGDDLMSFVVWESQLWADLSDRALCDPCPDYERGRGRGRGRDRGRGRVGRGWGVEWRAVGKAYPWYYAVNDRPVAIVEVAGGGSDCLVLEHATGNLVPDRSYFAAVTPGSGKDVDALSAEEFARLVADRRAGLVCAWGERLCDARSSAAPDVAAAFGVPLEPPPLGAARARVRGGMVPTVELKLREPLVLGDLERRLGGGQRLPRVDWDRPHVVAFRIETLGAPFRCAVLASCDEQPAPSSPVTVVTLRLDPAG